MTESEDGKEYCRVCGKYPCFVEDMHVFKDNLKFDKIENPPDLWYYCKEPAFEKMAFAFHGAEKLVSQRKH